jgi:hypothetical protein
MSFRSSVPVRLRDQHPETGSIPGSSTEKVWPGLVGDGVVRSPCGRAVERDGRSVSVLAGQSVSAAAQHLGARPGKKRDKAPCSRRQPPIIGPYHPYLPVRPRVAEGDLGQRWVGMCRAGQHRDT